MTPLVLLLRYTEWNELYILIESWTHFYGLEGSLNTISGLISI